MRRLRKLKSMWKGHESSLQISHDHSTIERTSEATMRRRSIMMPGKVGLNSVMRVFREPLI